MAAMKRAEASDLDGIDEAERAYMREREALRERYAAKWRADDEVRRQDFETLKAKLNEAWDRRDAAVDQMKEQLIQMHKALVDHFERLKKKNQEQEKTADPAATD
jgi:DNA repair exonuclease SbcCD ATPase subunit